MTHQQVIENFVKEGQRGTGFSAKATKDMLYSSIPARTWPNYRPPERLPLAIAWLNEHIAVRIRRLAKIASKIAVVSDVRQADALKRSNHRKIVTGVQMRGLYTPGDISCPTYYLRRREGSSDRSVSKRFFQNGSGSKLPS
jgi:hypothetical protein